MAGEGRGVRVYTVANESRYLVVRNVPAVGVMDELRARLSQFGAVLAFRPLDHPDDRARALGPFRGLHRRRQAAPDAANQQANGQEDEEEDEPFTDVVWVQFETVNNARHAKARATLKPFFGSMLRISYAPQDETPRDTALKLAQRRELLLRRARQEQQRLECQHREQRCTSSQVYQPPLAVREAQMHGNYARLQPPLPPEPASVKRRRM